ncbi:MAG: helix-turn-helix transcriptional regulator [Oscillospiraceae bacterium]|jgi:DNA-binding XRE family transcriptional regulator|nr:helix-turn-helix transcriptional regulator [Oscillospiraceae bacterium]
MNSAMGTSFTEYSKSALRNPDVRREYDALAPQYEIIAAILSARIERGITQTELARRVGTRQSNISRLERGSYNPSVEFLQKVAAALDKQLLISLR